LKKIQIVSTQFSGVLGSILFARANALLSVQLVLEGYVKILS
jgi:hypothetical protein